MTQSYQGMYLKNNYRIEKIIGEGGMGRVYLGIDEKNKRKVAIKQNIIPSGAKNLTELVTRFKREYLFLSDIAHPNIVKAYDFFAEEKSTTSKELLEKGDNIFMILEWVDGISLKEFLETKPKSLNLLSQIALATQIARAMEVINSAGIVHRDIKPLNIMIDEKRKCIKLLDLGIAKSITQEMVKLTQTGAIVGTPKYMSPEQVEGEIAANSDVFSLGVVLYQFFLWQEDSPFKRDTVMQTMMALAMEELPPLYEQIDSSANKEIYLQLSAIITQALHKDAQKRTPKVGILASSLENIYKKLLHKEKKHRNKEPLWQPATSPDTRELKHLTNLAEKYGKDTFGKKVKKVRRSKVSSRRKKKDSPIVFIVITVIILGAFLLMLSSEEKVLTKEQSQKSSSKQSFVKKQSSLKSSPSIKKQFSPKSSSSAKKKSLSENSSSTKKKSLSKRSSSIKKQSSPKRSSSIKKSKKNSSLKRQSLPKKNRPVKVIIIEPEELNQNKFLTVSSSKISIKGKVDGSFIKILLNNQKIIWNSKTKEFRAEKKLAYGKNQMQLSVLSKSRKWIHLKWKIIRPKISIEPIFRGNLRNTGFYPTKGVQKFRRVKWRFRTRQDIRCTPVITHNTIYFGGGDDYIYALDFRKGKEKWKFKTKDDVHASPAIHKGVLYCGSMDHFFYALNIGKGKLRWKFRAQNEIHCSAKVFANMVYFGDKSGFFYALDIKTGKVKWKFKCKEKVHSSPAIVKGVVYFGSYDDFIYALDAKTGKVKWKFYSIDSIHAAPIVRGGIIYFNNFSHWIYALNAKTGRKKWSIKLKGASHTYSSLAFANKMLFYGSYDSFLYALDAQTGKQKWRFKAGSIIYTSPSVAAGVVYFTCLDHYLYAVEVKTGKQKWRFKSGAPINRYSSPIIANGVVYFGGDDKYFYALE